MSFYYEYFKILYRLEVHMTLILKMQINIVISKMSDYLVDYC